MRKPQYAFEASLIGGHRINFDHLGFFNLHLNINTLVFLHIAPIKMQPPWLEIKPVPLSVACNTLATKLTWRVTEISKLHAYEHTHPESTTL